MEQAMQENHVEKKIAKTENIIYRKAKLWQIILYACSAMSNMAVYILIGQASYAASIGFGISTAIIGVILMGTRLFDAFTDSMLAFVYDRVNTRFGKIRVLLVTGYVIESVGLLGMFDFMSSKGLSVMTFSMLYVVYIIGYTLVNMTGQTIPALMSNDPKQRPLIGVFLTMANYLVPMAVTIVLNMVLLPMCGGEYNQAYLSMAVRLVVALIGYTSTMPQPTDALTPQIFWMTMILMYVLPILGWIVTLVAMVPCRLDKEEMARVQERIAEKKAAAKAAEEKA